MVKWSKAENFWTYATSLFIIERINVLGNLSIAGHCEMGGDKHLPRQ